MNIKYLVIILFLTFSSCIRSVVYSPALDLPHKILEKNEYDFSGAIELMPESNTEGYYEKSTAIGANI